MNLSNLLRSFLLYQDTNFKRTQSIKLVFSTFVFVLLLQRTRLRFSLQLSLKIVDHTHDMYLLMYSSLNLTFLCVRKLALLFNGTVFVLGQLALRACCLLCWTRLNYRTLAIITHPWLQTILEYWPNICPEFSEKKTP